MHATVVKYFPLAALIKYVNESFSFVVSLHLPKSVSIVYYFLNA